MPHFFIECGPKAFMETGKFQLLTRFEFPSCASIKSKLQHPPPTNPQAVELLKIGLACMKTGKSQLFSRFELSIFNILPRTNLWALSLLKVGLSISLHSPPPPPPQRKKLLTFPTQLFRRRQNRRPWLSTRQPPLDNPVQIPHPSQAKVQMEDCL